MLRPELFQLLAALMTGRAFQIDGFEDWPIGLAHQRNDFGCYTPRAFQIFVLELRRGSHDRSAVRRYFGLFHTNTPVPSSSFAKNAARTGAAKLGSSSLMAT